MSVTSVYTLMSQIQDVIICPYVDNMLIVGNSDKMIKTTTKILNKQFHMKDMGVANVIL